MVKSQTANLTFGPSFGHNLCFKNSNGSWELIFKIYIPKAFQWCKAFFNLMSFDPCNLLLKIRESIGTPTPKVGAHLGVWGFIPSHSFALPGKHEMWFQSSLLAHTFASPCFGREPKARIATTWVTRTCNYNSLPLNLHNPNLGPCKKGWDLHPIGPSSQLILFAWGGVNTNSPNL